MSDFRLYNRDAMVTVLVAHQRQTSSACLCGWAELGKSHAEHVANEYEKFIDTIATVEKLVSIPDMVRDDNTIQAFMKFELAKLEIELKGRGEELFGGIDISLPGCVNLMEPEQEYLKIVYSYRSVSK